MNSWFLAPQSRHQHSVLHSVTLSIEVQRRWGKLGIVPLACWTEMKERSKGMPQAVMQVGQNRTNKNGSSKCSHLLYLLKSLSLNKEIPDTENTEQTGKQVYVASFRGASNLCKWDLTIVISKETVSEWTEFALSTQEKESSRNYRCSLRHHFLWS